MKTPYARLEIRRLALIIMGVLLWSLPCLAEISKFKPRELPLNQPEQITAEADAVRGAAVSADGKWLAYARGRENFSDLWLRSADPARVALPRRLTNDPSAVFSPAFSPDNRFVAYVGESHDVKGDLFLLDIQKEGGAPIRITGRETVDGGPCFSPDGETLYFHQAAPGAAARYLVALDVGTLDVDRTDPGDDVIQPIPLEVGGDGSFASVSPDGKRLAFVSFRQDPAGDIFVFDLEARSTRALTGGPAMDFSPAWSHDGGKIFFSRVSMDSDRDGTLTDRDASAIFILDPANPGPGPLPLTPGSYSALQPRIAGERLFFLSDLAGVFNCWALPAEGVTPALERGEDQIALAESVSGKIPFSPELAIAAWSKVLERFPNEPDMTARAGYEIGEIHREMGMDDAAHAVYERVEAYSPDVRPWAALSMIRREVIETNRRINAIGPESGRRRSLEEGLERIRAITDGESPAVKARGALERAGMLAESGREPDFLLRGIALLDGVITAQSGERALAAEAMVLKGDIFARIAGSDKVIPVYLSVVDEFGDVPGWTDAAVERIIDIRMAGAPLGDPGAESGEKLTRRVEALRKIAGDNMEKRPAIAMGALNRVGDLLHEAGELARAKDAYARVLDRFKEPTIRTASARLSLAEILYREERFRQALDLYETEIASRSYGDDIYKLARIGFIRKSIASGEFLYRTGEIYAARSRFKSVMDYDDGVVEAHRGYIKCAAAMKDIPATLAGYRSRLAERPGDPLAFYAAGLCLTWIDGKEAVDESRTLLEKAIRLDGQVEYYHQTLGYVLETLETVHGERGSLELALDSYRKAWFLNDPATNSANAANLALNLGNAYYLLGRYARAFEFQTRRLEIGEPFDDPNREIVFYQRLGASAFQAGDSDATIHAFTRALELIEKGVDPGQASRAFDRLHRFAMDRLASPGLKRPDLAGEAGGLAEALSANHQRLGRLTSDVRPPPDPHWNDFSRQMERLLLEEEKLFPGLVSLAGDLKTPDVTREEAARTLAVLAERVRRDLALPGRLMQLKAEMLDRLGLALQEAEEWERAAAVFEEVYTLNERLGLHRNLVRSRRAVGFNTYKLAGSRFGEEREALLRKAARDFVRCVELVEQYGVPEETEKEGEGLLNLSLEVSLDEGGATRAARGFSADQEKRIAEAFITRVGLELGNPASAENAIREQLAHFPMDRPVSDADRYGVSLLYHRAGLVANALGKHGEAFDYFSHAADLCLEMGNSVSAAVNAANMAGLPAKMNPADPGRAGRLTRLSRVDARVTRLLAENPPVSAAPAARYHNAMGVHAAAEATAEGGDPRGAVNRMMALQRAGTHFSRGLRRLPPKDAPRQNRQILGYRAALHLNMAGVGLDLGDAAGAEEHFKEALESSRRGVLPNFQWRALAGLGRLEEALEMLEAVTISRAGCGPDEITSTFGGMVAALVRDGKIEDAFNLAEHLSELERFNRMAFLLRGAVEKETALFRGVYPVLERIRGFRDRVGKAEGEEKAHLARRLADEEELLRLKTGAHFERLPDPIRFLPDDDQRERILILLGLAAHAEELAEEMTPRSGPGAAESADDPEQDPASRRRDLMERHRKALEEAVDQRPEETPADLFTFFGPEPFEAADVMDSLPEDGALARLFKLGIREEGREAHLLFIVTMDDITAHSITSKAEALAPRISALLPEEADPVYIAYENPELAPPVPHAAAALGGSHLVRAIMSRKPFKRSLLSLPALDPTPPGYEETTPNALENTLPGLRALAPGVHTLLLSDPVSLADSAPTRPGEASIASLFMTLPGGGRAPMENILMNSDNLSLGVLPGASMADAYFIGHLFSIYGCPAVILPDRPGPHTETVAAFLAEYAANPALEALHKAAASASDRETRWILLGDAGMSPGEAAELAADHFKFYLKSGVAAFKSHRPVRALALFENAIYAAGQSKKLRKHLPALHRLARESAFKAGDLEKATAYASSFAEMLDELAPDSEANADALLRLGLIHANRENYEDALPDLEDAVEMMENLELGERRIDALADLGEALESAAEYERALLRFESAAKLSDSLDETELLAAQYINIGRIHDMRLSRYGPALKSYRKALAIYMEAENAAGAARVLVDMGRCHRLMGNFAAADESRGRASTIMASEPENAALQARILIEQANNAWFQARYEEAFRLQRETARLARVHDLPLMRIIARNTSGLIWWTLGDNGKALDELDKALAEARAFKKRRDEISSTLNNKGVVLREMGRFREAMAAFDEALAIDEKLKSRWAIAYDLRNMAMTRLRMGEVERAIPLFLKAAETAGAIGNRINEAKALLGLADAYQAAGKAPEAGAAYGKALELSRSMAIRETEWRSIFGLARLKIPGDDAAAETLLMEAVEIIEGMRAEIRIDQLKDSFINNKLAVYETLVALLADKGKVVPAMEMAERSRARNFIDLLGNQRLSLRRSVDQERYDRHAGIRARIVENESLLALASEEAERAIYKRAIADLDGELKDLMLDIQADNPQLGALVSVQPIDADALLGILEPGVALLSYYVLPDEILCWLIRREGIRLFRTPTSREALGRTVLEYRRTIQNLEPLEKRSGELHRLLLAPVGEALEGIRVLGIIPHGSLHYLSFATLSDGEEHLIDRFSLFYLPSASVLNYTLGRRGRDKKELGVLAIGNPDLGEPLFDLPFSEHEVNSIRWNFPKITILTGKRATEEWVAEHIHEFGVIHLASHGEFDPVNPLFSAVKLSRGARTDGNLEASEVFGLEINADTVVLSACQTGLGKVTDGDDVIGLNRAFFYAGTHTVVSSLWRVSDISTAILIKQFYRHYATDSKADSLRRAVLHVKKFYPHPGYWGAFTLVGDYF